MNQKPMAIESGIFLSQFKMKKIWQRFQRRRKRGTTWPRKLSQANSRNHGQRKPISVIICFERLNLGCQKNPPYLNRNVLREMTVKFAFTLVYPRGKF